MRKLKFGDKVIYRGNVYLFMTSTSAGTAHILDKFGQIQTCMLIQLTLPDKKRPTHRELRTEINTLQARIVELEAENGKGEVEIKTSMREWCCNCKHEQESYPWCINVKKCVNRFAAPSQYEPKAEGEQD